MTLIFKLLLTILAAIVFSVDPLARAINNKEKSPVRLILLAIQAITPFSLFVYGYHFYEGIFIPSFVTWTSSPAFWGISALILLPMIVLQFFIINNMIPKSLDEKSKEAITKHESFADYLKAVWPSLAYISGFAGIYEEFIFRFLYLVALFPLVNMFAATFPLIWMGVLSYIPVWITLGVVSQLPSQILITGIVSNTLFGVLHLVALDGSGKFKWSYWFRFFSSWIPGWIYFLGVINYGVLIVVLLHCSYDMIGLVFGSYFTWLVAKKIQTPAQENLQITDPL